MSSSIFSESLQWRFRGIQGVKHRVVIYSSSFCASLFNIIMGAHWAVPVHSLQFLSTIHSFMIVGYEREISRMNFRFSYANQFVERYETSLSLLCATVAANKTKPSSICFCWESFNNRWVLNTSPMNINSACSVLRKDLIICVFWLSCNFLLSSQSFANHVAINIFQRWDIIKARRYICNLE